MDGETNVVTIGVPTGVPDGVPIGVPVGIAGAATAYEYVEIVDVAVMEGEVYIVPDVYGTVVPAVSGTIVPVVMPHSVDVGAGQVGCADKDKYVGVGEGIPDGFGVCDGTVVIVGAGPNIVFCGFNE